MLMVIIFGQSAGVWQVPEVLFGVALLHTVSSDPVAQILPPRIYVFGYHVLWKEYDVISVHNFHALL